METNNAAPLELVTRTMALVEHVASKGTVGVSELARNLSISKSGAFRIAQSLVACDWLVQNEDRRYRLGPAAGSLAIRTAAPEGLIEMLTPAMGHLHRATQESIHLTRLDGRHIVYLAQLASTRPVRSVITVGARSPAHAVSPGLVQLAHSSRSHVDWFLRRPLTRYTPSTISTHTELELELETVRQRGYALNVGNYREDVGGVACAVLADGYPIAALSICAPTYRLSHDIIVEYGALLRKVVDSSSTPAQEQPLFV